MTSHHPLQEWRTAVGLWDSKVKHCVRMQGILLERVAQGGGGDFSAVQVFWGLKNPICHLTDSLNSYPSLSSLKLRVDYMLYSMFQNIISLQIMYTPQSPTLESFIHMLCGLKIIWTESIYRKQAAKLRSKLSLLLVFLFWMEKTTEKQESHSFNFLKYYPRMIPWKKSWTGWTSSRLHSPKHFFKSF